MRASSLQQELTPQQASEPGAAPDEAEVTDLTRHGLRRFQEGNIEQARRIFTALVGGAPERALSWSHLAMALIGLGEHNEAVAALRRSLQIDPGQAQAWASLAGALAQLHRYDEAESAGLSAVTLAGETSEVWQIRAMARTARDDFAGAADAFAQAVALDGENGVLYANLGASLLKCGHFAEADQALARALEFDPASEAISNAKTLSSLIANALDGPAAALVAAGRCADEEVDALFKTGMLLLGAANRHDAARRVAEAWAARRPDSAEARHLRDAQSARTAERQPAAMVVQRFDEVADVFDQHLLGQLGYDGPGQLRALMAHCETPRGRLEALDLGCGTGLCGEVLRPYVRRLVGVDLSGGMLAKARDRNLYERLEQGDIVDFLAASDERWDLVVAFDTLPYLGPLEALFAAVAEALRPGGWFAVSTEHGEGDGYRLRRTGRFAHTAAYLAALTGQRFEIVTQHRAALRREGGRAIEGGYYLLRRTI